MQRLCAAVPTVSELFVAPEDKSSRAVEHVFMDLLPPLVPNGPKGYCHSRETSIVQGFIEIKQPMLSTWHDILAHTTITSSDSAHVHLAIVQDTSA